MSWSFETDETFQEKLDWVAEFVGQEVEPLDFVLETPYDVTSKEHIRLIRPLQRQVKEQRLWGCHLGPELGGEGYGQVKLALLNEILGRSKFGPTVFGTQAPDSGNSEILAHYGTPEQKKRWLEPLLANEIVSCFSMTEPQGGADPLVFKTKAELVGDEWVINGEKWFSSNANFAAFLIVMAVTEPDAAPHQRMSMIIVPKDTPGLEILRHVGYGTERVPTHPYLRYTNVRVPRENMLGARGRAFEIAQTRLGGGRIHHAMRTIAQAKKALDMMCERVLSRYTSGSLLAEKQMVQEKIADSWIEIEQFRLLVLRTAWLIDKHQDYKRVRRDIAAVKAAMPKLLHDVASRALHLHGSYGISTEAPFMGLIADSFMVGLADGPTEVHKITVAKQTLREYKASDELFPKSFPLMREKAAAKFNMSLDEHVGPDMP